jgi:hypothetical protein
MVQRVRACAIICLVAQHDLRVNAWTVIDAARLRAARESCGETQEECAARLVADFRAPVAPSQGSLHNWEHNRAKSGPRDPRMTAAIRAYSEARLGPPAGSSDDPVPEIAERGDLFPEMVAGLLGERPMSELQRAAFDGLLRRVSDGPPLGPDDTRAWRELFRIAGLLA